MTRAELENRLQDFWHLMTPREVVLERETVWVTALNRTFLTSYSFPYPVKTTFLFPQDFADRYWLPMAEAISMFDETRRALEDSSGITVHRPDMHRLLAQELA